MTTPEVMRADRKARERALGRLAARQHGVVSEPQLAALGFPRGALRHRLSLGRLHQVHPGVYAVGHSRLSRRGRWMAAVLACGEDAVLSHLAAAALAGIVRPPSGSIDVTTTRRGLRPRAGVRLHRVRSLHPNDRSELDGIPVTAVARTLLDLAEVVSFDRLKRAIEEADRLGLLDMRAITSLCARSSGRQGLKPLRAALSDYAPAPEWTRSELEREFVRLCADAGLPRPAINNWVAGFEVDALWEEARLVVELDGYAFHRTRAAFERDRTRDARLQAAGYRVLRISHRMLERERDQTAAAVRSLLGPLTAPAR